MLKVLWIEDELSKLKYILEEVKSRPDTRFVLANTVSFALQKIKKTPFDLVILDLTVPLGALPPWLDASAFSFSEDDAGFDFLSAYASRANYSGIDFKILPPLLVCSSYEKDDILRITRNRRKNDIQFISKTDLFLNTQKFMNILDSILNKPHLRKKVIKSKNKKIQDSEKQEDISSQNLSNMNIAVVNDHIKDESENFNKIRNILHDETNRILGSIAILANVNRSLEPNNKRQSESGIYNEKFKTLRTLLDDTLKEYERFSKNVSKRALDVPQKKIALRNISSLRGIIAESLKENDDNIFSRLYSPICLASRDLEIIDEQMKHRLTHLINRVQTLLTVDELSKVSSILGDAVSNLGRAMSVNGNVDTNEDSFCINQEVIKILRKHEALARARTLELKPHMPKELIYIGGSSDLFESAFNNLMENAIKYNHQMRDRNAWIDVRLTANDESEVSLSVESWGNPVNGDVEMLAADGMRGEHSDRVGRGEGLYFTAENIAKLKGTVSVKSRPTKDPKTNVNTFEILLSSI